jgi:hypothetical protein
MADAPAQFVAATTLGDGRPVPETWRHLETPVPWLSVFAARLPESDEEVAVFTPGQEATERQQDRFERARSAWLAAESEGVAPVLAHGDSPRPWLAVEPWSPAEQVPPTTARSLLIDIAEGVWQVESAGWSAPPREWVGVRPEAGSGVVCWPLGEGSDSSGVELVAAVGYELLTGEGVQEERVWPGTGDPPPLWQVLETALTTPETYGNCYELKRALLFGPATPLSDPTPSAPVESDPDESRLGGVGAQLSRRAAVGVLGAGALGLTGLFARGDDTDAAPEQSRDEGVPTASFRFVQNRTTLEVIHEGGDAIPAGNLFVRNPRISGENIYLWGDYSGYDDRTLVTEGDSILIDRRVMSMWFVEVVWQSTDGNQEVVLEERQISEEEGFGQG